jgi:fructoselysine-6-P-deglycase FrlB-like protein
MGLLKKSAEKTVQFSLRVPLSVSETLKALRKTAESRGFDLTESLSDAVVKWAKQVQEELSPKATQTKRADRPVMLANGSAAGEAGKEI